MRDAQNIREVESVLADAQFTDVWMGFIFWPQSKRYCAEKPAYLPSACKRVGVFVNAELDEIVKRAIEFDLTHIQLHGDENRQYLMFLRQALAAAGHRCEIVKAMSLKEPSDIVKCEPYVGFTDAFLFDTPTPGRGGSGNSFDWSLLAGYSYMTPFILSGGIGPDSIEALRQFDHPCWEGIDLNSKFEIEPGLKDVQKLRRFLVEIKG